MISGEGIAIMGLGLSIIGLAYKVSVDDKAKTNRIYNRLDEVKSVAENKFTSKEVCNILHTQLNKDISEIKSDIKDVKTLLQRQSEK